MKIHQGLITTEDIHNFDETVGRYSFSCVTEVIYFDILPAFLLRENWGRYRIWTICFCTGSFSSVKLRDLVGHHKRDCDFCALFVFKSWKLQNHHICDLLKALTRSSKFYRNRHRWKKSTFERSVPYDFLTTFFSTKSEERNCRAQNSFDTIWGYDI